MKIQDSKKIKREKNICEDFLTEIHHLQSLGAFKRPFLLFHVSNQKIYLMNCVYLDRHRLTDKISYCCLILNDKKTVFISFKNRKNARLTVAQMALKSFCDQMHIQYIFPWSVDMTVEFVWKMVQNTLHD